MNIKDLPHVTVEQVLALRKAAIEIEAKNKQLEDKLAEVRQDSDDTESLYIENLKKELSELKASLPKIKADAVQDFCDWLLSEINWDVSHYGKEYANKLEAGK